MNLRAVVTSLLVGAVLLPLAQAVLYLVSMLLGAMGDEAGRLLMDRLILAALVLWLLDLVVMLVVLALAAVAPPRDPPAP